jgi:hypothetical protein
MPLRTIRPIGVGANGTVQPAQSAKSREPVRQEPARKPALSAATQRRHRTGRNIQHRFNRIEESQAVMIKHNACEMFWLSSGHPKLSDIGMASCPTKNVTACPAQGIIRFGGLGTLGGRRVRLGGLAGRTLLGCLAWCAGRLRWRLGCRLLRRLRHLD